MYLMNYVSPVLDSAAGAQLDVVYLDYQKLFDSVYNDAFLSKFANVGFSLALLQFLVNAKGIVGSMWNMRDMYLSSIYLFRVELGQQLGHSEVIVKINVLPEVIKNAGYLLLANEIKLYVEINNMIVNDCKKTQTEYQTGIIGMDSNIISPSEILSPKYMRVAESLHYSIIWGVNLFHVLHQCVIWAYYLIMSLVFESTLCKSVLKVLGTLVL